MKLNFPHLDASENLFTSRQLEVIRAQPFQVQYADLLGFTLVPAKMGFHPGAQEYTYRVYDRVGRAIVSSDSSDKGPRANVRGAETVSKFRTFKMSYATTLEEIRAAMMANLDLTTMSRDAAFAALAVMVDDAILLGSNGEGLGGTGLTGLFTASGTEVYSVPAPGGSTLWTAKTPDEVVQDMHAMTYQVVSNSKDIEKPNTMVLPLSRKGLVSSTRMGDGSNQTILSHFLETNGTVTEVLFSQKLDANGAWTGARAVVYNRNPLKLEAPVALINEQLAPQYDGYEIITHCQSKSAGTVIYAPKSICYADNI